MLHTKLASINNFSDDLLRYSINDKEPNLVQSKNNSGAKGQLNEYTNSQLVLIFYYFFKYLGIEPRKDVDIAPIAKFLHLITGKKFSNTQNSDTYKKLLKVPNHITDKNLKTDLIHIKKLFQKVELNEIVKMIDNEIYQCITAIKETKAGKR